MIYNSLHIFIYLLLKAMHLWGIPWNPYLSFPCLQTSTPYCFRSIQSPILDQEKQITPVSLFFSVQITQPHYHFRGLAFVIRQWALSCFHFFSTLFSQSYTFHNLLTFWLIRVEYHIYQNIFIAPCIPLLTRALTFWKYCSPCLILILTSSLGLFKIFIGVFRIAAILISTETHLCKTISSNDHPPTFLTFLKLMQT